MTRIKPRQGSFDKALEAFSSGDLLFCLELLSESALPRDIALRARALLRLGKPLLALESIQALALHEVDHELAAELLIIKVTALNILRRFDEAASTSIEARVRCFSAGIVAIEAELLIASAIGALIEGDESSAEFFTRAVLDLKNSSPAWLDVRTYRFSLKFFRARACELIGSILRSRSQYGEQAVWHRRAIEELHESGVRDDILEAALLSNFADSAINLGLTGVAEVVLEWSKRIQWTPFLAEYEFALFSSLAEAYSRAGDQLGALRFYRHCNACAPTAALQLRSTVDRARVLSEIGEAFSSREELDHAIRLSKSVDWANVSERDQRQLLFLAAQVASFSASEANRLLARYDGLKCSLPTAVANRDNRCRGEELLARSAVYRANADDSRAVIALMDALELMNSAGDFAKAANVAAELADLTGEHRYVKIVRTQCQQQPDSILARKLMRLEARIMQGASA